MSSLKLVIRVKIRGNVNECDDALANILEKREHAKCGLLMQISSRDGNSNENFNWA